MFKLARNDDQIYYVAFYNNKYGYQTYFSKKSGNAYIQYFKYIIMNVLKKIVGKLKI